MLVRPSFCYYSVLFLLVGGMFFMKETLIASRLLSGTLGVVGFPFGIINSD